MRSSARTAGVRRREALLDDWARAFESARSAVESAHELSVHTDEEVKLDPEISVRGIGGCTDAGGRHGREDREQKGVVP
jgi:hypothetical protein